ncbi:SIMPL domain-containing protein [Halorhabdus sp. BNX81]|uniref:SIMPL domain-containing protein n=1 Tax=Halorhabdus sp. BNX81 TaxID=2980181 RepID=UPI0023DD24A1|nr:SIMPL domain-containing protein [Halorhabdus sp. BNX81]WEL20508.1 putative secereted protein, contains kinase-interacting SIMPL domain [Halorhabdus sp. BNX81]
MKLNRSTLLVAAVAVLLLAAVGAATAITPAAQTDQPAKQIDVAGSAEVSAQPDQAVLRLGVVATAEDAQTARTQVAENVTAVRSALTELNVSEDQIETGYYDIGEVRERPETEGTTEYRAVHTLEVTLDDTERVGDVIDTAIDSGANRVDGVSFTLSEERRHELRQDALQKAMDRARTDADTLATSGDLQVVGASSISASDVSVSPYRVEETMTAADAVGGAASTTIERGPVDVSASVQVVYNATSA